MPGRLTRLVAPAALLLVACGPGSSAGDVTAVATAPRATTTTTTAPPSTTTPPTTTPATTTPPTTTPATTAPPAATTTAPPTTAAPPITTTTTTTAPADGSVAALDLLAFVRRDREHRGGYDRELFGYPTSFGGGCDTRDEVLSRDSLTRVQMDTVGCQVVAGDWYSPYDGLVTERPEDLQIDHVVALKEAWDSGAWQWTPAALEAYGNDLTDARTLRAVSSESNQDKGDKDPSNWLPSNSDDVCRYVADWVSVKVRWGLSMDDSEFGRVRNLLRGPCSGQRVAAIPRPPVAVP